ncbi:putative 50S ribosomal protein L18 [Candidatus Tremblaya princeps PCIT]|uniref:Putative 50S ribosomal protein L18 n=1 Tax=Tremblaya princeps (strain PCIT) TaxID=891398 RepID=F7XYJ5_TREPP|nr:putative 50S ribosomal protein L18 [Candidatus Tremblaya princeps PCIT]AFU55743.1 putative 50S ribosomal protein L18 [Candidatus Tremblaya princeps PCVAL]
MSQLAVHKQSRPALLVSSTHKHVMATVKPCPRVGAAATASTHCLDKIQQRALGCLSRAAAVGALVARRAVASGMGTVWLCRGSLRYPGIVSTLADSARLHGMML